MSCGDLTNRCSQLVAETLLRRTYFFPLAFLLAAHRAFISWESLLRPAAVIPPPFLLVDAVAALPFFFAHRALIAAAILARLSADILRLPLRVEVVEGAAARREPRRFSSVAICRRMPTASSSDLSDISIRCG